MKTGQRLKVNFEGKEYIGEVIDIVNVKNFQLFRVDTLPDKWLAEKDIVL